MWFKRAHAHLRHTAVPHVRGHRHDRSVVGDNNYDDIHNFIMIFIHDVYKFIPTYRLTLSGYPTRETINQIGVA